MKFIFIPLMILFVHAIAPAQVSNKRIGNWSDPTLWNNNLVPNGADSVTLEFDVVIDETAACKFLHSNGHQVTVNTGIDFAVGKPMVPRDTATLLTITTTSMDYGELSDSVHRVLKNSYVNGLRRIVAMENHGTPQMTYTVFTYNNQNQLESLLNYNPDGYSNQVYKTSISYTNNRVSKLVTGRGGQRQSVQLISYVANGANTDVVVNWVDTALTPGGNIALIYTQKNVLTVSSSFNPISKNLYGYKFYPVGPKESFDTTNTIYQYDAHGNLSEFWQTYHSTLNYPNDPPYRLSDTSTRSFVRDNPDSASVYRFLLDVYGNELLTLIDYGLLPLEIRDVTGYVYPPYGQGEYRQQTASSMIFSSKQYSNGHLDDDSGSVQQYRAVNQFDNRHRLVKSIIDDGGNYPFIITMRLEYAD